MARQLWLLRHADAEPHGARSDAARQLTERGERQSRAAGMALARLDVAFGAILVSPKARARETAEIALAQMDSSQHAPLELYPPLANGFRARDALDAFTETGTSSPLLLVGHEPDLSSVAGELCGGRLDLKKGGLAAIRLGDAGSELILVLRPAELALLGGMAVSEV